MEDETLVPLLTAWSLTVRIPPETEAEKVETHIRLLDGCAADLRGVLNKLNHGALRLMTQAEQDSARRVLEGMLRQMEAELFVARGELKKTEKSEKSA